MSNEKEKGWSTYEGLISFILTTIEMSLYIFVPAVQDIFNSSFALLTGGTLGAIGLWTAQATILHLINIKFPQVRSLFKAFLKKKPLVYLCLLLILVFISLSIGFIIFKSLDKTIPSITVVSPKDNVIRAEDSSSSLIYRVYYEDENELGDTKIVENDILLGDCTADVFVMNESRGCYIVSINNISGSSGAHQFKIKEGAIKDRAGNKSKEIDLATFYLYNDKNDIDSIAPQISLTSVEYTDNNAIVLTVTAKDNNELSSFYIQENNIILLGCSADIQIENNLDSMRIVLTNISNATDKTFKLAISGGAAKDMWGNDSASFVSDNISVSKLD